MKAGSVGDDAWRKRGKRSLATGPVAAAIREKPGGGGGMFGKPPEVTPRKLESAASPIAPRVERKMATPTMNRRPTFPAAVMPANNYAYTHRYETRGPGERFVS